MSAAYTGPGEEKPTTTLSALLAESYRAEEKKFIAAEYHRHKIEGCPIDGLPGGGFASCIFHGMGGSDPLPGWPDPGRHSDVSRETSHLVWFDFAADWPTQTVPVDPYAYSDPLGWMSDCRCHPLHRADPGIFEDWRALVWWALVIAFGIAMVVIIS